MEKTVTSKEKILSTAESVLLKYGYENTSLNVIIRRSGVSKGTFYHYFNSKEGLLDQMLERMSTFILKPLEKTVNDPDISAVDKFNHFMNSSKNYKLANKRFLRSVAKWLWTEDNIKLRHKIINQNVRHIIPYLERIILQGVEEGSFDAAYPREAAESIISISIGFGDQIAPAIFKDKRTESDIELVKLKMKAYEEITERILGAEHGALEIYDEQAIQEILKEN